MGRVESVTDTQLGRQVARKTLRPGADPGLVLRLDREARLTAQLDHPGIIPVFDAGRDAADQPWYTMRLVRGRPLAVVVGEAPDLAARLRLLPRVLAACQAIGSAHAAGVVHRDLTPSNVMIGPYGETVVVDWGLARRLDEPDLPPLPGSTPSDVPLTQLGAVLGTPTWMAPEQARGEPADRRADVYALGRILDLVVRGRPDQRWPTEVPADLAAIVAKATADRLDDRYADATALAADLDDWLAGRRVAAHRYNAGELARRVLRAWRVPLAVGGVGVVAVIGVSITSFQEVRHERDRALSAEADLAATLADARADLALRHLHGGDPHQAAQLAADALDLADQPVARAVAAHLLAGPALTRTALLTATCERLAVSADGASAYCQRGPEITAHDLPSGDTRWTTTLPGTATDLGHLGTTLWLLDGRDARRLDPATGADLPSAIRAMPRHAIVPPPEGFDAAVHDQASLHLLRAPDVDVEHRCPGEHQVVAYTPDGPDALYGCSDGTVWRALGSTTTLVTAWSGHSRRLNAMAVVPNALLLATLDGELLYLPDGAPPRALPPAGLGPIRSLRTSPGGRYVLALDPSGHGRLLDVAAESWLTSLPDGITQVVWTDDHTLLTSHPHGVDRWTLEGQPAAAWSDGGVARVATTLDGGFATGDGDGRVLRYDPTGAVVERYTWAPTPIKGLLPTLDGAWWLSGANFGSLGLRRADGTSTPAFESRARAIAPFRDGGALLSHWGVPPAVLHADGTGHRLALPPTAWIEVDAAITRALLHTDADGIWLLDLTTFDGRRLIAGREKGRIAMSADGQTAVSAADDALVWRLGDDTPVAGWPVTTPPTALALSPDGALTALGYIDGTIAVRATLDGTEHLRARVHTDRVSAMALSADGSVLLTSSWDRTTRRWALARAAAPSSTLAAELRARLP